MGRESISSRKNPVISEIIKLSSDKQYRRSRGLMVAEGTKLLSDALKSNIKIVLTIVAESAAEYTNPVSGARNIVVPDKLFSSISTQKSPQGAIFEAEIPRMDIGLQAGNYIVLDSVQDPGNVGTVIRTASALGMAGVILSGSSADPFSPKTVRASMGAVYNIPLHEMTPPVLEAECKRNGIEILCAMPSAGGPDVRRLSGGTYAVVIGNEGAGVCREMLDICAGPLNIPMREGAESLNAAGAATIIMWELGRDRY